VTTQTEQKEVITTQQLRLWGRFARSALFPCTAVVVSGPEHRIE